VWWLVAGTDEVTFWLNNGQPPTGQWAFRVKGERWVLDSVPSEYLGRKANLLVELRPNDSSGKIRREVQQRKRTPDPLYLHESNWAILRERPSVFGRLRERRVFRELAPFLEYKS